MGLGIAFLTDFVLKLLIASEMPHVDNAFDLVLWFSFHKFRGRFWEVRAMFFRFLVWQKISHMKHIVNLPLCWEVQLICYVADDIGDREWSIVFCSEFYHQVTRFQICCFEPDLLTQGIGLELIGFS